MTTTTQTPPVSPLESSLAELRTQIDHALDCLWSEEQDPRATVTAVLGIDPQPEALEAIVRIARDPLSRDSLRESSCTALSLRVLAERAVRDVMAPARPDVESVARAARILSGLLEARDTWEQELHDESGAREDDERGFLLQVGDALLPDAEPLIAGTLLAPRLVSIVHAAAEGDPREAVKTLTDEDVDVIRAVFDGADPSVLTAIALRAVIEDDVALWKTGDASAPRDKLLARLRKERTAYRYVTRLMQTKRSALLGGGTKGSSQGSLEVQARLFAAYLALIAILNAQDEAAEAEDKKAAADKLDELLRESAKLDAIADEEWAKGDAADQACLEALQGIEAPVPRPVEVKNVPERGLRNPRVRMRVLLGVASAMFLACIAVYVPRLTRGDVDLHVPTTELPMRLEVIEAIRVGRMMHVTVGNRIWSDLDRAGRVEGIAELGESAAARGMTAVYVTNEAKDDLAVWTRADGVSLTE